MSFTDPVPRRVLLLPDGRLLSERALSKIRGDEQGHAYVERELVRFGAHARRPGEAGAAWLREALAVARPVDLAPRQPSVRIPAWRAAATRRGRATVGGVPEGGGGVDDWRGGSPGDSVAADEFAVIWDWFLRHRFAVPMRTEHGYEESKQRALADLRRRLEGQRGLPLLEESA